MWFCYLFLFIWCLFAADSSSGRGGQAALPLIFPQNPNTDPGAFPISHSPAFNVILQNDNVNAFQDFITHHNIFPEMGHMLYRAVHEQKWNIAIELATRGASVNAVEFVHVLRSRNIPLIKSFIERNEPLNFNSVNGTDPLSAAIELNNLELVNILLGRGLNPWTEPNFDIEEFINRPNLTFEIIKTVLRHPVDPNSQDLKINKLFLRNRRYSIIRATFEEGLACIIRAQDQMNQMHPKFWFDRWKILVEISPEGFDNGVESAGILRYTLEMVQQLYEIGVFSLVNDEIIFDVLNTLSTNPTAHEHAQEKFNLLLKLIGGEDVDRLFFSILKMPEEPSTFEEWRNEFHSWNSLTPKAKMLLSVLHKSPSNSLLKKLKKKLNEVSWRSCNSILLGRAYELITVGVDSGNYTPQMSQHDILMLTSYFQIFKDLLSKKLFIFFMDSMHSATYMFPENAFVAIDNALSEPTFFQLIHGPHRNRFISFAQNPEVFDVEDVRDYLSRWITEHL